MNTRKAYWRAMLIVAVIAVIITIGQAIQDDHMNQIHDRTQAAVEYIHTLKAAS